MAISYPPPIAPLPPVPKTANYVFATSDAGVPVQFNAAAGALTATLPDPLTVAGKTFIVKKMDVTTNPVTVTSTGTTIDGDSMVQLIDQYAGITVMAANGVYNVIAITTA